MYKGLKIVCIIPARGGSKGLPGKNMKNFMGKPLIEYSIKQVQKSKYIDYSCVSTDSNSIQYISELQNMQVIKRPYEYAQDDSPSSAAIIHALHYLAYERTEPITFDVVLMLECTSPLRKDTDIDDAIEMFIDNYGICDSLVCITEIKSDSEHPYCVKKINADGYLEPFMEGSPPIYQRQQLNQAFSVYGGIYIAKVYEYFKNPTFYRDRTIGYKVERWQKFEIDDEVDFICAEAIAKTKQTE
jgi:CMP-N-acetylneuraminic acid synthetase